MLNEVKVKTEKLEDENGEPSIVQNATEETGEFIARIKEEKEEDEVFDKPELVLLDQAQKETAAQTKKKVCKKKPCEYCGRIFGPYMLERHLRIHTGERPFKCDLCLRAFKQSWQLNAHKITHREPPQADEDPKGNARKSSKKPCEYCGHLFSPYMLERHLRVHNGEGPYKCDECPKAFKQLYQLNAHKITHSAEKVFKCNHCEKVFCSLSGRNRHMINHDGLICNVCGIVCDSDETMREHELQHLEKPPVTSEPPQEKASVVDSSEEPKDPGSESKLTCRLCSKEFANRFGLRRHGVLIHGNREELECEECGFTTKSKKLLKLHIEKHLEGKTYNKLKCDECDYVAFTKELMNRHVKVHTENVSQLLCGICKYLAIDDRTLQRHYTRMHAGIRNFKCEHCELSFLTQMSKMHHEKKMHRKASYLCKICLKYYSGVYIKRHRCKNVKVKVEQTTSEPDPLATNDVSADEIPVNFVQVKMESGISEMEEEEACAEVETCNIKKEDDS